MSKWLAFTSTTSTKGMIYAFFILLSSMLFDYFLAIHDVNTLSRLSDTLTSKVVVLVVSLNTHL